MVTCCDSAGAAFGVVDESSSCGVDRAPQRAYARRMGKMSWGAKLHLAGVVGGMIAAVGCGSSQDPGSTTVAGASGSAATSGTSGTSTNGGAGSAAGGGGTSLAGSSALGGTSGASGSGGASGSSGGTGGVITGAGGLLADPEGDPVAVPPNLDGLVPHSSRWLLTYQSPTSGAAGDFELLDLADHRLYPANPGGPQYIIGGPSPDARTFFFSDGDGSRPSARIIRLEPEGFVPAKQLEDYTGIAGAYRVLSWSFDSRFAVISRGAGQPAVEIVDMRLGKRLATESFSSIVGGFAPKGYAYYYDAALVDGYQPKYARITQAGSTPRVSLPVDAKDMVFDPSGTQLFYALGVYPASDELFVISLADGTSRKVPVTVDGEFLNAASALPVAGDSVVVNVEDSTRTKQTRRRVFLDGKQPSVTLSDPARFASGVANSADNNSHVLGYAKGIELDLMRVAPYARQPLSAGWVLNASWSNIGFIGAAAYLSGSDGLHWGTLDAAGQLSDTVLSAPGKPARACANPYGYTPQHKLAYVQGDGEELVFLDLDVSPPAVRRPREALGGWIQSVLPGLG